MGVVDDCAVIAVAAVVVVARLGPYVGEADGAATGALVGDAVVGVADGA